MSENQGYFSLIQYSEYPARNEYVNIGIVLYANVKPYVLIKFTENKSRVQRAFGINLGKHFDLLKESMESRIIDEFSSNWSKSSIDRFNAIRSGKIRLSAPKSVLISDPRIVLQETFENLVGGIKPRASVDRVHSRLRKAFSSMGVENLLDRKPEPVQLPQGLPVKPHYGYQNGSYNLINAVSLRDDPDKAIASAGEHAIKGRWLSKIANSKKKLIVVGDVENQEAKFINALSDMFYNHSVGFYPLTSIDPLVDDIRKNVTVE